MPSTFETANYATYITKVLKSIGDSGMTGDGVVTVNNLVRIVLKRIVDASNKLVRNKKTLGVSDIEDSTRLVLSGELLTKSLEAGQTAVEKYSTTATEDGKGSTKGVRAGLIFPVTRTEKIMSSLSVKNRKGATSSVFLTAVLETLTREILTGARNISVTKKKKRIVPRHLMLTIRQTPDLNKLYSSAVLSGGIVTDAERASTITIGTEKSKGKKATKKTAAKKTSTKKGSTKKATKKTTTKAAKKTTAKGGKKTSK